ncbi:MAG: hypothetical protein QM749_06505 [Aquabacterium sp.]
MNKRMDDGGGAVITRLVANRLRAAFLCLAMGLSGCSVALAAQPPEAASAAKLSSTAPAQILVNLRARLKQWSKIDEVLPAP